MNLNHPTVPYPCNHIALPTSPITHTPIHSPSRTPQPWQSNPASPLLRYRMQRLLHNAAIPTTAPRRKSLVESIHYVCSVDAGGDVLIGTAQRKSVGM